MRTGRGDVMRSHTLWNVSFLRSSFHSCWSNLLVGVYSLSDLSTARCLISTVRFFTNSSRDGVLLRAPASHYHVCPGQLKNREMLLLVVKTFSYEFDTNSTYSHLLFAARPEKFSYARFHSLPCYSAQVYSSRSQSADGGL